MAGQFWKNALIIAAIISVFIVPSCSYLTKTSDFDVPESGSLAGDQPSKKIPLPPMADDLASGKFDQ